MKRLLLCLCLLISRHGCEEAEVVGDRDLTIIDEDDIAAGDEDGGSQGHEWKGLPGTAAGGCRRPS